MKVSLEWLSDHVELPAEVEGLVSALTDSGTEVVGREARGHIPDKVVVAQILSSEQHPNADRLSVCQVDDGSGQPRQIVCGAKNYKPGDKVPLALPGAVLGPDFKIKAGKLRGVASEGMMCSAKELALAEDAEGLLILPPDAPVGRPLGELFRPDTVLELEVTSNRPDLLGYLGIAREVAAVTGSTLKPRETDGAAASPAGDFVRLEDDGCPFYTARIIRGVKIGPSPQWLADRLATAGLRPINNVVDVTNYVLLETGQPLHAFDLAKLSGGIVVRSAVEGETLQALDGAELRLRTGDLVIADREKAVALAGVMGGMPTGVTETTTDLLLESAWFEPARVRRTSRELGLQTDSSYRFERGVDPGGVLSASARAVELILQTAGGTAEPEVPAAGEAPVRGGEVGLDNDRCRRILDLDVTDGEIAGILERLGLVSQGGGRWQVPSFRPDLTREIDLVEEVVRVAGIDRVPSRLRGFPAECSRADVRHDNAEKLRVRLRGQGFSEARTSHFVSPEALRRAGVDDAAAVPVRNPLGADQALLRPALLAGLLDAMARNLRHGVPSVRLFELGRVFAASEPEERTALGLIVTGDREAADWRRPAAEADLYDLKGVLEAVLGPLEFLPSGTGGLSLEVRGRGVAGVVRRLPREAAGEHGAKHPVYCAEIVLDGWLEAGEEIPHVRELPRFPAVERDLSVLLPADVPWAALESALQEAKVPHLESIRLVSVFSDATGEKLPADRRSLTVALTFREAERTLTAEEVDRSVQAVRDHLASALGATFQG